MNLWTSGDNLRKGAATNAVQVAEILVEHAGSSISASGRA